MSKTFVIGIFALVLVATAGITAFVLSRPTVYPATLAEDVLCDLENTAHMVIPEQQHMYNGGVPGQFPSLHITAPLHPFEQERNFWHSGTLSLSNHADAFEDTSIRIRGRGNSTWQATEEKRPLRLRFETPQSLLGSSYIARDWVLIANHFDLTLMRTHLAFYLGSLMSGLDWTPSSRLINLYINGEYMGVYQLTDERDIGEGRMQLVSNPNPAISEFLFELDGAAPGSGTEGVDFFFAEGQPYDIRYPRNDNLSAQHVEYMRIFVEEIATVLRSRNFEEIAVVMDIDSFIDFYLVQEFFKNIDVGMSSVFMQVRGQGENRRLYWGPLWDFDRSAGNMYYWYEYTHFHAAVRNNFMGYLITTPEIFDMVAARWVQISDTYIRQMMARAEFYVHHYSYEFYRNFERFPVWDTSPLWMTRMIPQHLHEITSWSGQMDFLQEWFTGRIWWMNQIFVEQGELKDWWIDHLNNRGE